MSEPSGNWHYGRRRHLRVCREQAWGELPESPAWQAVPVIGEGLLLKAANVHFTPDSEFGGYRRSVRLGYARRVAGTFAALPWPEVTALLLDMTLERAGGDLHSYCMDYCTPADARRYRGVVVEGLEMAARAGIGVVFRLSLKGKDEEANEGLAEEDFDYSGLSPVPFRMERAVISLDGAPVTCVEGFTLRVRNELAEGPVRFGTVSYLVAGPRTVGLALLKLDDSDALNDTIRTDRTMAFEATFAHPDGHTLSLSLPALHPERSDEAAPAGQFAHSAADMTAGTDENGDDITYALYLETGSGREGAE